MTPGPSNQLPDRGAAKWDRSLLAGLLLRAGAAVAPFGLAAFLWYRYSKLMLANIAAGFLLAVGFVCLSALGLYLKRTRFRTGAHPPRLAAKLRPEEPSPGAADGEGGGSGDQGAGTDQSGSPPQPPPPDPKIYHPEYAIGQGLITRDEYSHIRDEYFTQSQVSLGLILPLCLMAYAISRTPQLGLQRITQGAIGVVLAVLFVVGMDRWHKYESELQSLILSRWNNVQAAAAKAKQDAAATKSQIQLNKTLTDAIATAIRGELAKAHLEVKPFAISIQSEPPAKAGEPTA